MYYVLRDVFDTIVLRDVVQRAGIKDIDLFNRLLEYLVYNELLIRGMDVYAGKTRNGEVDFVSIQDQKKEYYQVAYYLYDQKVIDREFGAFHDIRDNYPKYVISFDKMDFSRDGIIHKNAISFLLEEEGLGR